MNKERRKQIEDLVAQAEDLKSAIEDIQGEEEEYRDNMPDNMQNSERYDIADTAATALETAADSIGEVISELNTASE